MGALMRAHAWSSSALGDPAGWPQPLKTTVELMINSKHPMFVAWGSELTVLYNDSYVPICGLKHPHMLGRALRAIWAETWNEVEPLVTRAMAGESVWFDDRHFVLERNGYPEDTWFSFSYSPVRSSGRVEGMFCVVTETTQQVLERRRAAFKIELADELRLMVDEAQIKTRVSELLGRHLSASCAGYAAVDDSGQYAEVEAEWTDGSVAGGKGRRHRLEDYGAAYLARLQSGHVTRVNDALLDPLTASAPSGYAGLQTRAAINAPILRDGRMVSILYVLDARPRVWTDAEDALIREVAERTGSAIERARAESIAALRNRRMELLARIAGGLVLDGSSMDRLSDAFQAVAEEVGAKYYFNFLVDVVDPGRMVLAASGGLNEAQREAFAHIDVDQYLCGRVAAQRRELVLEGIEGCLDDAAAGVRALQVRAYAGFPLIARGRLVGTLAFACTASPSFDAEQLGLMRTVADQTAAAIDREREADQRRQIEARLRVAAEELETTDRRKDEFLATLAHELRNPLAPLVHGLQLLRHVEDKPSILPRVRTIMERQLGTLTHLVDDLLDIARISGGKVNLRRTHVHLQSVIATAIETSQPVINAGLHKLSVKVAPESMVIEADSTRVVQVLSNLLNNAAKFTAEAGSIELSAYPDGDAAVVSVKDNGIGIDAGALPTLFRMFRQVGQPAEQRGEGGLGIGLSLVHRLVELHGGTVAATSPGLGKGSTFVVRIPLAKASDGSDALQAARPAHEASALRSLSILVVDDNKDIVDTLSLLLETLGHRVSVASNGFRALDLVSRSMPDVAFVDIGMPDMTGHELAQALRQLPNGRQPLLVALTGWGTEQDRARSRDAGFDEHLTKPTQLVEVEAVLAAFIRQTAGPDSLHQSMD